MLPPKTNRASGAEERFATDRRLALPSSPARADRERLQGRQYDPDKDEKRDNTKPYEANFIHLSLQNGLWRSEKRRRPVKLRRSLSFRARPVEPGLYSNL
jgi:hypothetical protein